MLVKDIMTTDVISLTPDMSFYETASLFLDRNITGAPVLNENKDLIGIVSEKDLFRALYPSYHDFYSHPERYLLITLLEDVTTEAQQKKIIDIMNEKVIIASPFTHVLKVGGRMVATGIHRVPVVEKGKVVGMVSRGDIYRAILKSHLRIPRFRRSSIAS